jgi:hypothetical protein
MSQFLNQPVSMDYQLGQAWFMGVIVDAAPAVFCIYF